jgi:hypothetical protein
MIRLLVLCSLCLAAPGLALAQGRDVDRSDTRSLVNESRAENRIQRIQDQKRRNQTFETQIPGSALPHAPAATR